MKNQRFYNLLFLWLPFGWLSLIHMPLFRTIWQICCCPVQSHRLILYHLLLLTWFLIYLIILTLLTKYPRSLWVGQHGLVGFFEIERQGIHSIRSFFRSSMIDNPIIHRGTINLYWTSQVLNTWTRQHVTLCLYKPLVLGEFDWTCAPNSVITFFDIQFSVAEMIIWKE